MKLNLEEIINSKIENFYLVSGRERDIDIFKKLNIEHTKDKTIMKIIRGKRCKTKDSLFQEFAAAFQFPYYFGQNWQSFDECITDLSWMPAEQYLCFITDLNEVLFDNSYDLKTFFIILKDTVYEWSQSNESRPIKHPASFYFIFHCEPENEEICRQIFMRESIRPVIRVLTPNDDTK